MAWALYLATFLLLAAAPKAPLDAQQSAVGRAPANSVAGRGVHADTAAARDSPILAEAERTQGIHLRISVSERKLWLQDGDIILYSAPVAVGKPVVLEYDGQRWNFETPRGRRRIEARQEGPVWIPPDWHYVETAVALGLQLVRLEQEQSVPLGDGTRVEVRGSRVGRVYAGGRFVPVPVGDEVVFGDTLFIPPLGSANRRIAGALGEFKLDLGDGYYIHGTPDAGSIGTAVTHGCIRLLAEDLRFLYQHVAVGTPVFLY